MGEDEQPLNSLYPVPALNLADSEDVTKRTSQRIENVGRLSLGLKQLTSRQRIQSSERHEVERVQSLLLDGNDEDIERSKKRMQERVSELLSADPKLEEKAVSGARASVVFEGVEEESRNFMPKRLTKKQVIENLNCG
mmetsp:Transcript_13148/g.22250  ORF Transcript_13148/g.22250 Transcript_13148/m.22250 type:complete len:138 (-) Transcript_13148:2428-2841(-)